MTTLTVDVSRMFALLFGPRCKPSTYPGFMQDFGLWHDRAFGIRKSVLHEFLEPGKHPNDPFVPSLFEIGFGAQYRKKQAVMRELLNTCVMQV